MSEAPAGPLVRRARPDDLEAVGEITVAAYAEFTDGPDDHYLDLLRDAARRDREAELWVAEVDGSVVGAAWLLIAERVPSNDSPDRRYGDVQSVEVREEYRNRGIGAALIAAILAEAGVRDLLHVTVHSSRRAVDFYQRVGFCHHRQLLLWEPD